MNLTTRIVIALVLVRVAAQAADTPRSHVETIASSPARYVVVQRGTMDGRNCRSPMGVYEPFEQSFESNRAVRIENIGTTDLVNPWLSNGRNDGRTLDEIVARAVDPKMSEREKATALWFSEIERRYHFTSGDNSELCDPVKVFNSYGFNTCGEDSICMAGLWKRVGLKAAPARLVGHCVSQIFYDGRWHLFDGDMHSFYLLRDNETVAGEQDIVRDHDLVKRTHTHGILHPDSRSTDEWEASLYVFEGAVNGSRNCDDRTTMNMVLRPGEAIVWGWGPANPVKFHGATPPMYPQTVCNGRWEYRPDFSTESWRKGASSADSIASSANGLASENGKSGAIVWRMHSPYVFVGGKLDAEATGAKFSISMDGKSWESAGENLDKNFPPAGPARYEYWLRCELAGDARLKRLAIINDLQMALPSLPEMGVGENAFTYSDQTTGDRKVRITHEWVERSTSRPPLPPPAALNPPNGGENDGTDLVFRWTPPADPDGDAIADYQFVLSDRPDLKWPLSMSFFKLISRTADAGKSQYTLPASGLLSPDKRYYWHVRARDAKGVWGPWSETWSFTPRGPAFPTDVRLDYDATRAVGTLRWKANAAGRKPSAYRVYGSDEKGFSISDEPYKVTVGISKELPEQFTANFVAEVRGDNLDVVGADVALPNANKVFYRVVAVDERGKRSGPSDYAEAPRPLIVSKPVTQAKVGEEYRATIRASRSLGDLRLRVVDGKETASFWDIERVRYAIASGPTWLKIDEASGLITGKPDAPGQAEVAVTATIERDIRTLNEDQLKWGIEKVVSLETKKGSSATQKFAIEVEK